MPSSRGAINQVHRGEGLIGTRCCLRDVQTDDCTRSRAPQDPVTWPNGPKLAH